MSRTVFRDGLFGLLLFCVVGVCLLGGCGKNLKVGKEDENDASRTEDAQVLEAEWPDHWSGNMIPTQAAPETETAEWAVSGYRGNLCHTPAGCTVGASYAVCWESRIFYMRELIDPKQQKTYELTIYDVDTDTSAVHRIDLDKTMPEGAQVGQMLEEGLAELVSIDAGPNGVFLFFQYWGEEQHYYAAHLNEEAEVARIQDLGPALAAQGDGGALGNRLPLASAVDGEGRFLTLCSGSSAIVVMDAAGNYLNTVQPQQAQEMFCYLGKLPDGSPLYQSSLSPGHFFTFDGADIRTLCEGEGEIVQVCGAGRDGKLFYNMLGALYCWDVVNGKTEVIFSDKSVRYEMCDGLIQKSSGELCLFLKEGEDVYCNILAKDAEAERVEITVTSFVFDNRFLTKCADDFSRKHPGVQIQIREPADMQQRDAMWDSTLAELAAGKGPDVVIVDRGKLEVLQKKGVVADLSELLDADCRSQIFPGALEYGTVDGKLYGITGSVTASAFLVSDEVWQADTWTVDEFLDLAEEQGGSLDAPFRTYYDLTAGGILYNLALANLENSGFLDPEQGNCSFDTDRFCRVLEFCRQYGRNNAESVNLSVEEQAAETRQGKALVLEVSGGLTTFSEACAALGEGWHTIGFPTEKGDGYLLECYSGCAAVNAAAVEKRPLIDEFLASLVDYDMQKKYGWEWVRMDVLQDSVTDAVELYGTAGVSPVFFIDGQSVIPLAGKPDGSSYLPEYLAVLRAAAPASGELETVRSILFEETAYYFDGAKNAEETAKIIQRRVRLWLDERQ